MRAHEAFRASNVAVTSDAFVLNGGRYQVFAIGTFGGSGAVGLQQLGPDGTTYIAAHTALSATGTFIVVELPPGTYKVVVADTTALYWSVVRIPGE